MQNLIVTLLGILIIFLPSNLGKHFVNVTSYVGGNLVDYLVPTFYLTDLMVVALLFLFSVKRPSTRPPQVILILLLTFAGFLIVNVLLFPSLPAVYKLGRLLLYLLLTLALAAFSFSKRDIRRLANCLNISVIIQCLLALGQFIWQRSLCGYFCLGEPALSPFSYGITRDFFGQNFLILPYGTFPHPNILGGFLAVSLPLLLYFFFLTKRRRFIITLYLALVVLLLTKSQAALLVGLVGLGGFCGYYWQDLIIRQATRLVAWTLFFPDIWLTSVSFWRRLQLADVSLKMIADKSWWGVGLNQFIPQLYSYGYISSWPAFLQPVHNIYLLIAAELGLPALIIFLLFVTFCVSQKGSEQSERYLFKPRLITLTLLQLLALGFWDHYLWTTPQGLLMLWLTLGFSLTIIKPGHANT